MNKFLTILFLFSVVGLLIAASFEFEWAGGEGYEKPFVTSAEIFSGQSSKILDLKRGESIETRDGEKAVVRIGETIVLALDQRTTITLEKILPSGTEIKITRGRLLAWTSNETKELTISSLETSDSIESGAVTAVRYDWLEKTEITPFDEFDWESSGEREFYEWGLGL